ncbi:hypothetical protein B566_EDAN017944 [Ephemera danica]|nr:hypothetical protein B566_EDAN017944 [Ephemera danica]
MLRAFCSEKHNTWDEQLEFMRFAINSAVSETTGVTPAELFLGRKIYSPADMRFMTQGERWKTYEEAVDNDISHMEEIHQFVNRRATKMKERQARYFNRGRRDVQYEPGQLVLIKSHPISSAVQKYAAKLASPWLGPYEVIDMFNNVDLTLRDVRNHKRVIKRHVSEVKPFITRRESLSDVLDVAPVGRQPSPQPGHGREVDEAVEHLGSSSSPPREDGENSSVSSSESSEWRGRLRNRQNTRRREYYQAGF